MSNTIRLAPGDPNSLVVDVDVEPNLIYLVTTDLPNGWNPNSGAKVIGGNDKKKVSGSHGFSQKTGGSVGTR